MVAESWWAVTHMLWSIGAAVNGRIFAHSPTWSFTALACTRTVVPGHDLRPLPGQATAREIRGSLFL